MLMYSQKFRFGLLLYFYQSTAVSSQSESVLSAWFGNCVKEFTADSTVWLHAQ